MRPADRRAEEGREPTRGAFAHSAGLSGPANRGPTPRSCASVLREKARPPGSWGRCHSCRLRPIHVLEILAGGVVIRVIFIRAEEIVNCEQRGQQGPADKWRGGGQ